MIKGFVHVRCDIQNLYNLPIVFPILCYFLWMVIAACILAEIKLRDDKSLSKDFYFYERVREFFQKQMSQDDKK